ncbi:MAG TPA: glutamate--tRNA ligase family protein [Gaiellaceae bacterium]|nr:glutamate--tRNA ligase family protein [Gaiellaceae bacterium]
MAGAVRVRFAPSPTGSLHLGGALTAVANRRFADSHGGALVLRIDDTDEARRVPRAEEGILEDLRWLGIAWDEGPVRQSERAERHREAAREIGEVDDEGALRFRGVTLLRADGRPTYHLASVVDDLDLGITHVIRGKDLLPATAVQEEIARALGVEPPAYVHHGLLVGEDGRKLGKRVRSASVAGLRELGIPPEAARAYLEELDLPRGDVRLDESRLRRLAVEALGRLSDEELAARAGAPARFGPALRGARDLAEARATAASLAEPPAPAPARSPETLERFRELREAAPEELTKEEAKTIVRELKAVGGDLRALRIVLTGAERGPELWAVLVALPSAEALRRVSG